MKKIRTYFRYILAFFSLARDVFPYLLLFYLILFLLENLFTGFVSNTFSLNWVLVAVLITGFLAACAPDKEEEEEKLPGVSDYILILVLTIIGGAIIYAKSDMSVPLRLITTLVSAGLIGLVGFVTLFGKDEELTEEISEAPQIRREYHRAPAIRWSHIVMILKRTVRPFLRYRVRIPLAYVLIFVIITAFLIPKNVMRIVDVLPRRTPIPVSGTPVPTPTPDMQPFFWDDLNEFNNFSPSADIRITIQNGGSERGSAASFSATLRQAGFGNVTIGNADRYDYRNALILFHPDDKAQASVVKRFLEDTYTTVSEAPAEASATGITVILGIKDIKESEE